MANTGSLTQQARPVLATDEWGIEGANARVGIGTTDPGTAKLAVIGGNVGIGTTNPNSSKGSGGYLDAKDIYLRDTGTWASAGGGNQVAILTGTVAHGGTIPLPDGYTQAQCKWFVSINTVSQPAPVSVIIRIECYADSNRVVTCRLEETPGWHNGTANYMIIGIK